MFDLKQKTSIENLERAFALCKDAGLYFAGCDTNLLVSSTVFYDYDYTAPLGTLIDVPYNFVNTHGTYIDSGGA